MTNTISADNISFTDDGHAWWVANEDGWHLAESLDRPCDTCDGEPVPTQGCDCEECICDCIDGRHTFEIEVECGTCFDRAEWCGFDDDGPNNPDCSAGMERWARVSVVPGMVTKQEDGTWIVKLKVQQ